MIAGTCRSVALTIALALPGCSPWPEPAGRPSNVPADALRIQGADTQWWIRCWREAEANWCHVFNAAGVTLHNEVFLPYDGGSPLAAHDLDIDPMRSDSGHVWMKNGRILLPSTDFARRRELLKRTLPDTYRR